MKVIVVSTFGSDELNTKLFTSPPWVPAVFGKGTNCNTFCATVLRFVILLPGKGERQVCVPTTLVVVGSKIWPFSIFCPGVHGLGMPVSAPSNAEKSPPRSAWVGTLESWVVVGLLR